MDCHLTNTNTCLNWGPCHPSSIWDQKIKVSLPNHCRPFKLDQRHKPANNAKLQQPAQ